MSTLHLLCAGAAKGLVLAMQAGFESATGATLTARFGAVGAMQEALLAGAPCDLMIVTAKMIDELAVAGHLRADSATSLGRVRTGIAVPAGTPLPDVSSPEALRAALLAASAIHFPDPLRATAGIHFAGVMHQLGIHDTLAPRLRTHPQGALAMQALAAAGDPVQAPRATQRACRSSTRRANHSVVSERVIFGLCSWMRGNTARGSARLSICSASSNTRW